MKVQGIGNTEEKFDLYKIKAKALASESDVQSRKEIAQSIIDRLIDRKFGKEYLHDLLKLNHKYSFQYEIKNGVRVYTNSILEEQLGSSQPKQELGKISVDENGNFSYHKRDENPMLQEQDVYLRAQLVQDCLDRILNVEFGVEYQEALLNLNNQYPVEFEVKNGTHVYSTETANYGEIEKVGDELLIPSEKQVGSEETVDSLNVLNKMIKDIEASKVAIQATEDVNIIDMLKSSYIVRRSKTINRKLKRDLAKNLLYNQIQELVESTYRMLLDRKLETDPTVGSKASSEISKIKV